MKKLMSGSRPMNKLANNNTLANSIKEKEVLNGRARANTVLSHVTPMIITFNEEANIERTLNELSWAQRVVIIDSYSTDKTIDLVKSYPNVEVFYNKFESFADQCNFGLTKVQTEWVLSLDADYVLSEKFINEMEDFLSSGSANSYAATFKFCVFGKALIGDNTTARKVLYKKKLANYINTGHQHRVQVPEPSSEFKTKIRHDDRKPLSRWLDSQDRYLKIEAEKIHNSSFSELDLADKIRKLKILAPFIIFFYCLFVKGLILQGWVGIHYTFQRTLVELLLAIRLIEIDKLNK